MDAKVIFGLVLMFGYCQAKGELVFLKYISEFYGFWPLLKYFFLMKLLEFELLADFYEIFLVTRQVWNFER